MMSEVYGRAIILRNCGRFLNVASDFGSEYKTHPFLTEQMVYAGLTRENDWLVENEIIAKEQGVEKGIVPNEYDFDDRYSLPIGVYFTCGYLLDKEEYKKEEIKLGGKTRSNSDINDFNSIDERTAGVQDEDRLPKYGNIEWILPNNYFLVFALAKEKSILKNYYQGQTFYMGKKRTMFQIEQLSSVEKGAVLEGEVELKLPIQATNHQVENFEYYNILTVTQRYILVKGKTRNANLDYCWESDLAGLNKIVLPSFFVEENLGVN